jgi:hypothetical protein
MGIDLFEGLGKGRNMTSEIALMNRHAVVLAADSAATVTYWERGRQTTRYFKGANKIFNLSCICPVGVMINGSGSLQALPWEVLIKAYRDARGATPFDTISASAQDFFEFLISNEDLFPTEYQDGELVRLIGQTAMNIAIEAINRAKVPAEIVGDERLLRTAPSVEEISREIARGQFIYDAAQALIDRVTADHRADAKKTIEDIELLGYFADNVDVDNIINVAVIALFKREWTTLTATGIVIAGFGKREYFAHLEQYECYGVLLGCVLYCKVPDESFDIAHNNTAAVVPIAMCEMTKTFIYGMSMEAFSEIEKCMSRALDGLIEQIKPHVGLAVDLTQLRDETSERITNDIAEYLQHNHNQPLRRAIGSLPVGELAELAESLISLESKKERVTRPSESIGGPIDVAVLSKGDGFIWIKRKHYFDPALNIQYVARKEREVRELHGEKNTRRQSSRTRKAAGG